MGIHDAFGLDRLSPEFHLLRATSVKGRAAFALRVRLAERSNRIPSVARKESTEAVSPEVMGCDSPSLGRSD